MIVWFGYFWDIYFYKKDIDFMLFINVCLKIYKINYVYDELWIFFKVNVRKKLLEKN